LAEFFEYVRVERPGDLPARDANAVEVAVLDMNHGFPNVGHDAIVFAVRDVARELLDGAAPARRVRVLSYAVRDRLMVPDHAERRSRLYIGTGGPGHLDPRLNTHEAGDVEIREDPSWEAPLWRLFEAIAGDEDSALFGVCHTFGLLCRWLGVATPVLRGPEKGGYRSGVGTNVLSPQALTHPWFARLAAELSSDELTVLDSRYYDMVTGAAPFAIPISRRSGRLLTSLHCRSSTHRISGRPPATLESSTRSAPSARRTIVCGSLGTLSRSNSSNRNGTRPSTGNIATSAGKSGGPDRDNRSSVSIIKWRLSASMSPSTALKRTDS